MLYIGNIYNTTLQIDKSDNCIYILFVKLQIVTTLCTNADITVLENVI